MHTKKFEYEGPAMGQIRIALLQINPKIGDIRHNQNQIESLLRKYANQADIFVCPELSLIGYPPRDLLSHPQLIQREQEACLALGQLTKELQKGLILGHTEARGSEGKPFFNAATLWDSGYVVGRVRKKRLPNYDIFDEERFFEAFSEPQNNVLSFRGTRLGLFICEDAWNSVSRFGIHDEMLHKKDSATLFESVDWIINISASPYTLNKQSRRLSLFAEYARNSKAPLAFVSSWGAQDGILFDGSSFILNPSGQLEAQAPSFEEAVLISGSRRSVETHEIENLHKALVVGIRDYARKTGFQKAVLGLSGGIDSALVASLAVEALGADHVLGVSLPSVLTSSESRQDAADLAQKLGIEFREISIALSVEESRKALQLETRGLGYENLQSRTRGLFLMGISNNENRLLLATGNKSELAMGYSTLYGDLCGALLPIGDLYKTEVYALSHWIHQTQKRIPWNTLVKEPSAELAPGQKDSDSLPIYPVLDAFLEDYLENQGLRALKWEKFLSNFGHSPQNLLRKIQAVEYKRYQAPPILKVHQRSFGQGWQMPIAKDLES